MMRSLISLSLNREKSGARADIGGCSVRGPRGEHILLITSVADAGAGGDISRTFVMFQVVLSASRIAGNA
jgi:hypothetical protein